MSERSAVVSEQPLAPRRAETQATAGSRTVVGTPRRAIGAQKRSGPPFWLVLALPVLLFAVGASRFGAWIVDDALISFGYARTLDLTGVLAQTTRDAPVEAVSNPSWTLLLSGLRAVGVFDQGNEWLGYADYVWVIRGLALVCFVGTLACLYLAVRSVSTPSSAATAVLAGGSLLALSPPYVMWSISGLENPLYALVVAGLLLVVVRSVARGRILDPKTAATAALLVVLAAATRPDGLVFAAAYPIAALAFGDRRWPAVVRAGAVYAAFFAVPVGLLLAWRHATFGLWVPNTAVAKNQAAVTPADAVARITELPTMLVWPCAVAVLVVVAAAVARRRGSRSAGRALTVSMTMLGLAVLGFCVLREDWMAEFRFGTPTVVLAIACLSIAAAVLLDARSPGFRGGTAVRYGVVVRYGVAIVLSAAVLATAVISGGRVQHRISALPISGCFVADRYGRLFNYYADRLRVSEGSLLAPDIGGTIMTSRLRVVDLAGLADPTIARLRAENDAAGIRDYVLDDVRPTFVHIHGVWQTGFPTDPRFEAEYVALGSAGDYVRREAIPAGLDARTLAAEGLALSVRLDRQHRTQDCGSLEPGQLPT